MYEFSCDQCANTVGTPIEPVRYGLYCVGCKSDDCGHRIGAHEVWCFNSAAHTPTLPRQMVLVATPQEVAA